MVYKLATVYLVVIFGVGVRLPDVADAVGGGAALGGLLQSGTPVGGSPGALGAAP